MIAQVHAAGLEYLPKPVKPAVLRALVIAVLHLFRPGAGTTAAPRPPAAWLALAGCTVLATSLCILLSYRRTAWIGAALPWSRPKCATWRNARPAPPAKSRN